LRTRCDQALVFAAVLAAGAAVSSPVLSADVINGGPPPLLYETPPAAQDLFAGWWIGGTLGGATANFDFSQSSAAIESSGVLGGITGGYNWQNGPIVIGLEGDVLGAGISGSGRFDNGADVANPDIDAMANLLLRAGVTVVPQVMPNILAYWLYRFEINIRGAAVLGVVGAGGIGFLLQQTVVYGRFGKAGMALVVVIVATILVDTVSGWVRRRIIEGGGTRRVIEAELEQPELLTAT